MTPPPAIPTAPVSSLVEDRFHGLDALRGGALLFGVVLHAAMAYLTTPVWPIGDVAEEPVANALFFAIHLFRMTTFFLIAGLFANMMVGRKGPRAFVRDRLVRIAAPLAVFWPIALGSIIAVIIWKAAIDNGGVLPSDAPPPPPPTLETFPLTHLWFLWVLLIFYAILLGGRWIMNRLGKAGGFARRADRAFDALMRPWAPVVLAIPLALALWLTPQWIAFFGIPTPDYGFVPDLAAFVGFGVAFGCGAMLDRRRDLLARIAGLWPVFLAMGAFTGVAAFVLTGGPRPVLTPVADPALKVGLAALIALAVYTTSFAALSLTLRFLSGFSPWRRYLADSSYWVYLIHLPLVMVGQLLLLDVAWPWGLKLAAVTIGVMTVALISYELLVRHSFIGRWLNGRRVPWRHRRSSAELTAAR